MAVSVTHAFVSAVPDSDDTSIVRPSNWNADHTVVGLGTAAEADTGDFATAAQGAKADTALQPAAIGVSVQAYDADLAAWAGVNPSSYSTTAQIAAAYQPLDSDLTAIAALSTTSYGRSLLALASTAALQAYAGVREVLTAGRTYYVRTDGSDSNTGLVNSSGGAFLTLQKAIDVVAALDISIYNVTIQVGDGTYTAGVTVAAPWVGSGTVTLQGNTGTPANAVITPSSGAPVTLSTGARLTVTGFKLSAASARLVDVSDTAIITFGPMEFGATTNRQVSVSRNSIAVFNSAYTISGGASNHIYAGLGAAIINTSKTITLTGTPAFSLDFVRVENCSALNAGALTFSGSATGRRYTVNGNSAVLTGGGGASYFPGDVGGVATADGEYT